MEVLTSVRSNIKFINRAARFETMVAQFTDESTAKQLRVTEFQK